MNSPGHGANSSGSLRRRMLIASVAAILTAAGLAIIYLAEPGGRLAAWLPRCPFHEFTGFYCPGCGMTRAIRHALHGELLAALRCNFVAPVLFATALLFLWKPAWSFKPWIGWTLTAVIILYWILRNLPCAPFIALAPSGC